jgi:hypothetical protein
MSAGGGPKIEANCAHPSMTAPADSETGLPGLRTWPRVYLVVVGIFFVWLALLTTLTVMFA